MGYGLPSKQTVNAVGGRRQARNVQAGCRLWTLEGERTVQTAVTEVVTVKVREVVEVVTDHVTFTAAPDQMLGTPDGWVHACRFLRNSPRSSAPDSRPALMARPRSSSWPTVGRHEERSSPSSTPFS